ncbi:MAG: hypothetical protein RL750_449 [Bacteroidota bacterium]
MPELFLPLAVAFLLTFLAVPVVIEIATANRLFDRPNSRKVHTRRISSLGGVAIFTGFFIACMLFGSERMNPSFRFYMVSSVIIFLFGLKDDLSELTATKKLIGQVIIAAVLIHAGGVRLEGMYGLFGVQQVPLMFSYVISYMTIIVIVNAFNLIDGVDGLATSLGILSLTLFGIYFALIGQITYSILALSLVGSLLAFLIFNHQPARIFMGDSGSLLIGSVNSILVIRFIQSAEVNEAVLPISSPVALGFAILFIPLFDTLRMFSVRLLKGNTPFSPDKNHLHHLLLGWGLSHFKVTLACVVANILLILFAWYFQFLGTTLILLIELSFSFAILGVLYYSGKRARQADQVVDVPVIDISKDVVAKAD